MGANTTNTDNRIYRELCQLTKNKTAWNEKIPYVASLLENSTPKIVAKAMWMLGEMGLLNPTGNSRIYGEWGKSAHG